MLGHVTAQSRHSLGTIKDLAHSDWPFTCSWYSLVVMLFTRSKPQKAAENLNRIKGTWWISGFPEIPTLVAQCSEKMWVVAVALVCSVGMVFVHWVYLSFMIMTNLATVFSFGQATKYVHTEAFEGIVRESRLRCGCVFRCARFSAQERATMRRRVSIIGHARPVQLFRHKVVSASLARVSV